MKWGSAISSYGTPEPTYSASDSRRTPTSFYDSQLAPQEDDETPYDREHPFFRTHNEVVYDKRMKPNDFRLLSYVFSKPPGWQCREDVVEREIGMGRKAYYASVRRLIALRYCVRTKGYDSRRKTIVWNQQWFRTPRGIPSTSSEIAHRLPLMVSQEALDKVDNLALRAPAGEAKFDLVIDLESVVTMTDHSGESPQWSVGQLFQK